MKQLVIALLTFFAKQKLRRSQPVIIGITGTVGKTTTKEIVAHLLSAQFPVKKSEGGLNSDIGLPLTILNQKTGYNLVSWIRILFFGFLESFKKEPARYFVAEMGADKPGDIAHLVSIAPPHISVVTSVARVHLNEDQFRDEDAIAAEKAKIVTGLGENDIAILNADNPWTFAMREKTKARVLLFGHSDQAHIRLEKVRATLEGITFEVSYQSRRFEFQAPVVGSFLASTFLPAILIAFLLDVPLSKIQERVSSFRMPNGRLSLIEGINDSWIIDSSYNSSAYACREALLTLSALPGNRKIAVLGNMNELGSFAEEEHREIGTFAAERCDLLVTVGQDAQWIAEEASGQKPGRQSTADSRQLRIKSFLNYQQAAEYVKPLIQKGDLILVKGSQNKVFLEELIKQIMKHPETAHNVLVRQGPEWEKKKAAFLASA